MSPNYKKDVVALLREEWDQNPVFSQEPKEMGCAYWTTLVLIYAHNQKIPACIQAGSLSWPRITPEEDMATKQTQMTHFSYIWEPEHPTSIHAVLTGKLPEIHIWAGLPETQEIIDLTTCYLPKQCQERGKLQWRAPNPPDFLWDNKVPEGVHYEPNYEATKLAVEAVQIILRKIRKHPIKF